MKNKKLFLCLLAAALTLTPVCGAYAAPALIEGTGVNSIIIATSGDVTENESAQGDNAIAIGNGTSADGNNSLAIGYSAHANKTNGIAIGNTAKANGEYGIAIGYKAEANGDSIAIGWDTTAGNSSIAIGNGAKATERINTAVGYGSIASGEGAAALGGDAVGNYSVALGTQAKANGVYSFAGADADADGEYSIAIGYQTKVSAEGGQSTAIGYRASATEKWSTAFGYYAKASGEQSIAVGYAEASAAGSAALGAYAKANGERSTALGRSAVADGKSSVALGDKAKAQAENSVAIGTNSSATEVNTVSFGGTYRYRDEETLTWHDATVYRRLVNVDKGLVAADSHEAINGSQLYDLGDSIRNAFGGNFNFENGALTGGFTYGNETTIQGAFNSIRNELDKLSEGWTFNPVDDAQQSGGDGGAGTGEGATVPASSTIKPGDSLTVNAGSNIEITGSDKDYTVSVSDNPKFDSVSVADGKVTADEDGLTVAGTDGNSVKIDGDSVTVADKVTIDKNGIDMDGTKLTVLGAGSISEGSTDAVSGGQLWETNQTVDEIGSVLGGAENGYKKPTFDAVTANDINVGKVNISGSGINMGGADITTGGGNIDMGGGRITNVAGGAIAQGSTDAVNGGQLWDAYQRMDAMGGDIYRRMDDLREDVNIVGAHAAALSGLHPIDYNPYEPTTLSAAVGTYRDEYAVAVGVFHYTRENVMFNLGASLCSDGDIMGRAGVSFTLGKSSKKQPLPPKDMNEVQAQLAQVQQALFELKAENKELREKLEAQR